jgi:RNA-binding protein 39
MTNPPIVTQCFVLSNMFTPEQETNPGWDGKVRDDVIKECNKYGGVQHIFVNPASTSGNVYVKCQRTTTAVAVVDTLYGRWFVGKVITAAYVSFAIYQNLFPDSAFAIILLQTNR